MLPNFNNNIHQQQQQAQQQQQQQQAQQAQQQDLHPNFDQARMWQQQQQLMQNPGQFRPRSGADMNNAAVNQAQVCLTPPTFVLHFLPTSRSLLCLRGSMSSAGPASCSSPARKTHLLRDRAFHSCIA